LLCDFVDRLFFEKAMWVGLAFIEGKSGRLLWGGFVKEAGMLVLFVIIEETCKWTGKADARLTPECWQTAH
jgi:hypothetical protein